MFELIVLLDLASAYLIDCLVEILDQMKAVMDQCRVREQLCDARNVGLPHIGRNGLDLALQIPQKSLQQGSYTVFVASLSYIKDYAPFGITHHRRVFVAAMYRLLIHTHMRNASQNTSALSSCHTAVQDPIHHIKLASKQLRCLRLILCRLQQSDRPGFKGVRMALRSTRPRNLDRMYPRGKLDPRDATVNKTPKLKPVQVPP